MMKKIATIALAATMAVSMMPFTAFAGETEAATEADDTDYSVLDGLKIGFSQCDNRNSWRIAETNSIEETAKKYGATVTTTSADGDIAKQATDIADLVSQGVDYLIVAPQEEDGLQTELEKAMDAGIPVILVDRSVNGEAGKDYTCQIMSDFIWESQQVAEYFIKDSGGKGNIVEIEGTQGATSTTDRKKGFDDAIAKSDMKIIDDQVADYVLDKGQQVMENILQAHGDDVDYVFCHNDDMAQGAIKAIKAAGYKPGVDIKVAGIDGPKAAMQSIIDGEQLCSCSCSPLFGPVSMKNIAQLAAGKTVDDNQINADTLYTIDNASLDAGF